MVDKAKLFSPNSSTFEVLVAQCVDRYCCGKELGNWALSVEQYWLQALQFLVCLIDLLIILLECNGFARIQKAVVDQTSIRPPNSDHGPLFGTSLALVSALEFLLGPPTALVIAGCCVKSTFCSMSQSGQKMVHCCIE